MLRRPRSLLVPLPRLRFSPKSTGPLSFFGSAFFVSVVGGDAGEPSAAAGPVGGGEVRALAAGRPNQVLRRAGDDRVLEEARSSTAKTSMSAWMRMERVNGA